jgi:hypothetical protein
MIIICGGRRQGDASSLERREATDTLMDTTHDRQQQKIIPAPTL